MEAVLVALNDLLLDAVAEQAIGAALVLVFFVISIMGNKLYTRGRVVDIQEGFKRELEHSEKIITMYREAYDNERAARGELAMAAREGLSTNKMVLAIVEELREEAKRSGPPPKA